MCEESKKLKFVLKSIIEKIIEEESFKNKYTDITIVNIY